MITTLSERLTEPTPPFFKRLRTIGLVLAAVSASTLASPVALPLLVTKIAGYLAVAGTVMSAVSQTAVKEESRS